MWAFFVPFTITSTTLYVVQPLFSFIQAKKLLSKKTCVLDKNRRTKGVSCKRSLSSFALMLDVSPPLNFQPFTRVQKQDCHLPLKSFYCVPFFLFYHVICFLIIAFFPLSPITADLIEDWAKQHLVLVQGWSSEKIKVKILGFAQCN